jgi:hypothetical protein
VIELERRAKEKRARRLKTRPEPTIFGNCDSWNFIVGKKAYAHSRGSMTNGSLQGHNSKSIHSLSTISVGKALDNLWAACEWTVDGGKTSRIVGSSVFDMPVMGQAGCRFYLKR